MTTNKLPKWTDERVAKLEAAIASETQPIQGSVVESIAEALETSPRSISSKLRKMGIEVASTAKGSPFSAEQTTKLASFVENNSGSFTYGQIAEMFAGGEFSPKQVQGKILSMKLTAHVKPTPKASESVFTAEQTAEITAFVKANEGLYTYAEIAAAVCGGAFDARKIQGKLLSLELNGSVKPTPKPESVKTYTDAEEAQFIALAASDTFLEDIASTLGKTLNSVRGKALSLLTSGKISKVPQQQTSHAKGKSYILAGINVTASTLAEIATAIERTETGVKALLTRRSLDCADYSGADKAAKNAAKKAAKAESAQAA